MAHNVHARNHAASGNRATATRIQDALSDAMAADGRIPRHRFVWRFLASLSALMLSVYQPAMPQEALADDWKPVPREPERDADPRNPFGSGPDHRARGRQNWNTDLYRSPVPPIRLAANEGSEGGSKQRFDIPAGDLETALISFSKQTGVESLYPSDLVAGRQTQGLEGDFTPEEGLSALLAGTGLAAVFSASGTVTLQLSGMPVMATPVQAAPSDQAKPIKVPEVVVKEVKERPKSWEEAVDGYKADYSSAVTRTPMSIDENPTSIGVVTRDVIRDTFARSQMDAFEGVSGITRSTTYGRGETFNIRGFQSNFRNGSFNAMRSNGLPIDGIWAPDFGVVERYEIVKGPASIVGGASTPGGLINRITKTPQRQNFSTTEFQAGSYGFLRGMVDANGVMPGHEDIRGRLVFAVEDGGNFVDNSPVRQYTVAPSVEFDVFKGAGKLLIVGMYQHFDGAIYPGYPLLNDGTMLNIPRTRNFGGGAPNGARTQYTGYNGEVHYDHKFIHDIKLSVKGKYSNSYLSQKTIYSYSPGGIPLNGDSYFNSALQQNRFDTYAGELNLSKEFELGGQKHEILAGVDYRDMTQNYSVGYIYLPSNAAPVLDNVFNPQNLVQTAADSVYTEAANLQNNNTKQKLKQLGIFAQAIIRPIERLTLVVAGRHDRADQQFVNKFSLEQENAMQSAWTGRFGATFKVATGANVYGGIQQSFEPQLGVTSDGSVIEPTRGLSYEVGAKLNLLNDRLRFTTALFRTYLNNVANPDPNNNRFVIAVGQERNQGAEFDVNGQPIPGLNLNANFAYINAKITEDNDPALVGQRSAAPQYVGRVFGTYELQSGPLRGFGFGGGVYFVGDYDTQLPNRILVNPYERVDGVLFYRGSKKWDVSFNLRNLLNAKYIENPGTINWANSFGAPISAFGTVRVYF